METFATGFLLSFNFFLVKAMRKDVGNYPHFFDYNFYNGSKTCTEALTAV